MAAGLGFKTFTTGEVLTAADTNGYLMQGVLVFASAAARDAAITSPQEGQFAYLKDTNVTTYYTGSAWANLDTTGMTNPMTTTGDIVYASSGSTPGRIGIGSTGNVLTVAGGIPSWAAPAGGGKVLQVVQATTATTTTITANTYADITNVTASITPSVNTSKVLVMISLPYAVGNTSGVDAGIGVKIVRASTDILEDDNCGTLTVSGAGNLNIGLNNVITLTYIDSPATTSATTYKLQGKRHRGNYCIFNTSETNPATASIILMEIGA